MGTENARENRRPHEPPGPSAPKGPRRRAGVRGAGAQPTARLAGFFFSAEFTEQKKKMRAARTA